MSHGLLTAPRRPAGRRPWPWHRAFLVPLLVVLAMTTLLPLAFTALQSVGLFSGDASPGDMSYGELLTSSTFHNALWVQAVFVVGAVVTEMVAGTGLALLLNRPGRWASFLRGIVLGPVLLPTIVVALIASYMLQSNVGLISVLLAPFGLEQAWLASGPSAIAVLIAVDVWQYTPIVAILVLAGLQGVPHETIEAARLDGTSRRQLLWLVVLPQVMPAIVAAGLIRFIDAIQVFPTIYVLTSGGPGISTSALNYFGFIEYFQLGNQRTGAASAVILTAITVVIAVVITRRLQAKAGI